MPDREKVVGHLYDCLAVSKPENKWVFARKDIVGEAIVLLKEQEPVKPKVEVDTWACGNYGALLERQSMVGENAVLAEQFDYCPHCGKAVKWDVKTD